MTNVICLDTYRNARKLEASKLLEQSLYLLHHIGVMKEQQAMALLTKLKNAPEIGAPLTA